VLIGLVGYMIAGATGAGPTDPAVLVRLTALETDNAALKTRVTALEISRPFVRTATGLNAVPLGLGPMTVLSAFVIAPVAGNVTINYSTYVNNLEPGGKVRCAPFQTGDILPDNIISTTRGVGWFETAATPNGDEGSVSGTAQFPIGAGQMIAYRLACEKSGAAAAEVRGRAITAIFTPTP